MKLRVAFCLAPALLVLATSPAAGDDWTAVGSSAAIVTTTLGYSINVSGELGYSGAGSLSTIQATYNVTNTYGTGNTPPWTRMTAYYYDLSTAGSITAYLFQFNPTNGAHTILCSVTSLNTGSSNSCTFSTTIDFNQYLYYVYVVLERSSASVFPRVRGLRVD